jgi:toxin ParE1/3/4
MRQNAVGPRAQRDLDDQAWYLAENANVQVALRFMECARTTFELLAERPFAGWACRFSGVAGVRVFRIRDFEKLLAFYRVDEEQITILRALHGAQDLEALLKREGLPG